MQVIHQTSRRRLGAFLSILILASLACSLSAPQQSTPQPTQLNATSAPQVDATPPPAATPTALNRPISTEKLPPALVETDPPSGSRIARSMPITFYFNQSMERTSVESALSGEPAPAGRFEWLDAATVRFTPDQAYPASIPVKFNFSTGARASSGTALQANATASFETAGPLKVADRLPRPATLDVNPASAVVVTFTDPVVALGEETSTLPPAFNLQPENPGKGEWINTSTYIFYPQPALKGGVAYTVNMNNALKSTSGGALALEGLLPADWAFTTAKPKVLSVTWGKRDLAPLNAEFVVKFNQPMDTASVEKNFRFSAPDGSSLPGSFKWSETLPELTFKPNDLLTRSTLYSVHLSGDTAGQGGTPIGTDFTLELSTLPALEVVGTTPPKGTGFYASFGYGSVEINFSAPLKQANFGELVRIEPAIGTPTFNLSDDGYSLAINAAFNPSTKYNFYVSSKIQDLWGGELGKDVGLTLSSVSAPPSLTIPAAQAAGQVIFLSTKDTSLQAYVTNISSVKLEVGRVDLNTFQALAMQTADPGSLSLKPDSSWTQQFKLDGNFNQPVSLSLTANKRALAPGLYYLKTSGFEKSAMNQAPYLLVVSRTQLTMKTGPFEITTWAVDLPGQTALPNQQIAIYAEKGQRLGDCTTDQDGLCRLELKDASASYDTLFAVTGQPGDPSFGLASTSMTSGLGGYDFGLQTGSLDYAPLTYLYTDRPIYRSGQTVSFRGVLRSRDNARYASLGIKELDVKITAPFDPTMLEPQTLTSLRLPVSEFGTVNGSFELPAAAAPGYYAIELPGIKDSAGINFQVAEYRKPAFDLSVSFDHADYLAGDPISATVNARYYFDAPTGSLPVTWVLYAASDRLYLPGGYQTGAFDIFWRSASDGFVPSLGNFIAQGEGQTGPDGKLIVSFTPDMLSKLDAKARQTLTLEVSAQDESNFPVAARAHATFHPAKFYAGIRPDSWGAQAKSEQSFSIQTVDWQSQPSGNHDMAARLSKLVWVRKDPPNGQYGSPSYEIQETEIASSNFRTDGLGRARIAFTPPEPGIYQVEVSGEGAQTRILVWVGGAGSVAWPNLPDQRIRIEADASSYSPGQSAKIRIPNPFEGKSIALITVERSRVMYQHVFEINSSMAEEVIPITDLFAPNAYVSVTVIGRSADGRPDFRQGYLKIDVKADSLHLNISVTPNTSRALPGDEITLEIKASDSSGKPVEAEFSLALVDKAVLALADPNSQTIDDAFYGMQSIGVRTSLNLANYAARVKSMAFGRGGGGGDASAAGVRSKFQDTAAWFGAIRTGADGKATQKLRLPDNLTTWVADLRGLTSDTRVGQATIEVVTSKDLLVRPVAPRFLVAGDHVRLGAIVQNNTDASLSTLVSLEAPGLTIEGAAPSQLVEIPAGERRRVDWWVSVQNVNEVDPLFSASAGSLSDSTHLEMGKLPVLRFSSPQTFATAGMLPDSAERLELVSLPRSFTPTGGELRIELSPSMMATVVESLHAIEALPSEYTEQIASGLLPNLAVYNAVRKLNLSNPQLEQDLTNQIHAQILHLMNLQSDDGGFGWNGRSSPSDGYLSSYVLFTLNQAQKSGFFSNPEPLKRLRAFVLTHIYPITIKAKAWELDQTAFNSFVLSETAETSEPNVSQAIQDLLGQNEKLSPWGRALLALSIEKTSPANANVKTLVSNLESSASRSASGANWQLKVSDGHSMSTPNFNTAIVLYALARLDPATPVITDAVRYLVLNRQPNGAWKSSYESSWVLLSLVEALQATGDLQSSFSYQAELNGTQVSAGSPQDSASALKPVLATIPLSTLIPDGPNALRIRRDAGEGRLYYRAFLSVDRPVESAPALERGLSIQREYFRAGLDCSKVDCPAISEATIGQDAALTVRLTITLPEAMYFVAVQDYIPAGAEIIDPNLKTSQQGFVNDGLPEAPKYDPSSPFRGGWGWWNFGAAQIFDQGIRWMAPYLSAGTYELTYRIVPTTAGEFRVLPAHAYQTYFPDIEATSAGVIFTIK
jgi:uncharacterized protein YfaS (alpha-2-macroglobulin family)